MNIGIDIDGVIFDSETYFRCFAEMYDIDSGINSGIVKKDEVRVQRRYDWPYEQFRDYIEKGIELTTENCLTIIPEESAKKGRLNNCKRFTAKNDFNLNLEKSLKITYIPKKTSIIGTANITLPMQPSNTLLIRFPIIPFEPPLYTNMPKITPTKIKIIDVASILISAPFFFFFLAT